MTREKFIQVLEEKQYSYEEKGGKLVVTDGGVFGVNLRYIRSLPESVEFRNHGHVILDGIKSLPPDVQFKNKGPVNLESLETISPNIKFNNDGAVFLYSIVGGWFSDWKGIIDGVNHGRILNKMVEDGLFDRE